jgi:hypothetical protein
VSRIGQALKHSWNVFTSQTQGIQDRVYSGYYGTTESRRSDKPRGSYYNERSIISSIVTRIAIDVSSIDIRHVRTDDQRRFLEEIDSGLNNCLVLEANIDQAARQFRLDIVKTLCDCGVCALVPVDTSLNPLSTGGYDIQTMRVGEIVSWFPKHVRVSVYNEKVGRREEITLPKTMVAIIENPLYDIMNEPSSTLQRLIRKLNLLDSMDEQIASGKLDLIIQLPYVVKSEAKRQQAEQRRKDIEFQLTGSTYGIAYADATEKITQLNRPAENNLLVQVEYLTKLLYDQLGVTEEVMNGTADEKTMINYYNRTIEPMLTSIVEAMRRNFLTKTARTQKQWILFFRDPFRLVPLSDIAEIADKFTRNEILSSNEVRQGMGIKPSQEPKADQLVNSNMPQSDTGVAPPGPDQPAPDPNLDAALQEFGMGVNGNGGAP